MVWYWPAWLTLLALPALLLAEYRRSKTGKAIAKPIASLGFILLAWTAGASESVYGWLILIGLILSMAGDVLLLGSRRAAFLGGLIAFLIGHLLYVAAFFARGVDWPAAALAASLLAIVAAVLAHCFLHRIERAMRMPVVSYAVVISIMLALAVGTVFEQMSLLILIGALLFYLSDFSVARDRLLVQGFVNRAWGLPAYFIGQLLLAASVSI
ncbi:MAG: lysoplasmalogenase [Wenzhouxiangellaceae bacterium]|nr:MAG: lysoplasmalogenase [Wenzhouxiangellaceae bacterium]